jgi:stage II sporulation protein B
MNKARITYRFDQTRGNNGSREKGIPIKEDKVIPLYDDEFQLVKEQTKPEPLNTFGADFGSWNSAFETESDRIERVIRESNYEPEKKAPARPDAPGPELDPELWSSWKHNEQRIGPESHARIVKSSSATPWFRIAASVAAALMTGVAFGFFVLSMFTNRDLPADKIPVTSQTKQTAQAAQGTQGAISGTKDTAQAQTPADQAKVVPSSASTAGTANSAALNIAAKSYAFLQHGVFSSLQSAQNAQSNLKKKGYASALQQGDKTTVFMAFAANRDDALSLSQQIQEQKLDVLIKNVEVPGVTAIRWNGTKPEALAAYLAQGDKMIQMLSGLTLVHLAETKQTTLDDSTLQGIVSGHRDLTALAATLNEGVDKQIKASIDQMNTAINSSVQSMEAYKKNPSAAMLWQTQSSLMQYILTQKELLEEIRIS